LNFVPSKSADPVPETQRRAIVIGGSMAGMLAARVLAESFDEVLLIERDAFPDAPRDRSGVPQAKHVHALLPKGQLILEELFPGLNAELTGAGAMSVDVGSDIAWLTPAGWGVRFPMGVAGLSLSRSLLDWGVRRRVAALANVRILNHREATGLIPNDEGDAVCGVTVRHRQGSDEPGAVAEIFRADLIVEASGRASKLPHLLTAIGYETPRETIINAHLGYASRFYKIPSGLKDHWKAILVQAAPPLHVRGGLLFPVEDNRWIVTLVGGDRDYPPTDEVGFLGFARSLRTPVLYDAIRLATPLTPVTSHRGTENRRRHYEQLSRWPERLLVLGDSVCAFNPVYGQGMTTAAIGADCLRQSLRREQYQDQGFARRFQRRLAGLNTNPWMLATGEDYRYQGFAGGSPSALTRFMHWYVDRTLVQTTFDVQVRRRFLEVQGMIKTPSALFHPALMARLLGQLFRKNPGGVEPSNPPSPRLPSEFRGTLSSSRF
jgi:2-polyprenyl-6-methoxyphenol hydroxylase-like FAD-dependent oxidoreductase